MLNQVKSLTSQGKTIRLKFVLAIMMMIFSFSFVIAQSTEKIVGTIGNEKLGSHRIVICVYGTAACMPVNIDTTMTVKFQGKETKLTELPFGLYLEAEVAKEKNENKVKSLVIDENKTVICLTGLKSV